MKNALIIFILVLSSYLIFNKFVDNDSPSNLAEKEAVVLEYAEIDNDKESSKEVFTELLTESFNSDSINRAYATVLNNENIKATLSFSFHLDGTFNDVREMTHPKLLSGETKGTYIINGSKLELNYADDRDKDIFKFDKTIMELQKDGSLRTGSIILTPQ